MYAVIRTGNKQYRVEPGMELLVERLPGVEGGKGVDFDDVLLLGEGANVEVGTPRVVAKVSCLHLGEEKGPKLRTIKYRRRKNFRRSYGHRQTYSRLRVESIQRG